MMYLVLTAMLALNVSTDILNGFTMVDKSLHSSIDAATNRNTQLYADFKTAHDDNPEKTQEMYDQALLLHRQADSLFDYIQDFKTQIVILADGEKKVTERINSDEHGDPTRAINSKDNNNVTGQYALVNLASDGRTNGAHLRENITRYRDYLCKLVHEHDPHMEAEYQRIFATDEEYNEHDKCYYSWEEAVFHNMPVSASVTVLTKIQNDIRATEGQLIQYLMGRTDAADLRVNKYEAHVIPLTSDYVLRGGRYQARIVLAAVDSTKTPQYFVDGQEIGPDGLYDVLASNPGSKTIEGYLTFLDNEGNPIEVPFSHDYTVGEPAASVSNMELNAIYADYNNKYSVSVPGVSPGNVRIRVEGGQLTKDDKRGHIEVRTSVAPGQKVKIIVSADVDGSGKMVTMSQDEYVVRALPKPQGWIKLPNGKTVREKAAGTTLSAGNTEVVASYGDDVLLKLDFDIVGFQTRVNGKELRSNGSHFSADQMNQIKKLKKGTLIKIENVRYKPKGGGKESNLESFVIELV
ncbi:MAG: gliding motility protein GldM [Paludibacteraceae bacterium]|nr:gliding motility protein GldM [Paludibacteraceae bacterium]